MAELKKVPLNSVNEEVISMEFDENPNIPTANYSEETGELIQEAIKKKLRAEKLKKMIETELKHEEKSKAGGDSTGLAFTFKGM